MEPIRPTVYLVDADASVRIALSRLFRSAGMRCFDFATCDDFLSADIKPQGACVVADVCESHGRRLRLPALLRERRVFIPVIYLSARDLEPTHCEARRAGAAACFRKPVDDRALLDAIGWALSADTEERPSRGGPSTDSVQPVSDD